MEFTFKLFFYLLNFSIIFTDILTCIYSFLNQYCRDILIILFYYIYLFNVKPTFTKQIL